MNNYRQVQVSGCVAIQRESKESSHYCVSVKLPKRIVKISTCGTRYD